MENFKEFIEEFKNDCGSNIINEIEINRILNQYVQNKNPELNETDFDDYESLTEVYRAYYYENDLTNYMLFEIDKQGHLYMTQFEFTRGDMFLIE